MGGERTFDPHRIVVAGRGLVRCVVIVNHVDSPDERDGRIDAHKLAMHASQAAAAQRQWTDLGAEYQHLHAGACQHVAQARRKIARTKSIEQEMNLDAAHRRTHERACHEVTSIVVRKNIGFDEHLALCSVERRDQCREVLLAALE